MVLGSRAVDESKVIQPLKPVIRMATAADEETERRNKEKEKDASESAWRRLKSTISR